MLNSTRRASTLPFAFASSTLTIGSILSAFTAMAPVKGSKWYAVAKRFIPPEEQCQAPIRDDSRPPPLRSVEDEEPPSHPNPTSPQWLLVGDHVTHTGGVHPRASSSRNRADSPVPIAPPPKSPTRFSGGAGGRSG